MQAVYQNGNEKYKYVKNISEYSKGTRESVVTFQL